MCVSKIVYVCVCVLISSSHSPITLLQEEARLLRAVLLVTLGLVDAVAVARVFPVHVLLKQETTSRRLNSKPSCKSTSLICVLHYQEVLKMFLLVQCILG